MKGLTIMNQMNSPSWMWWSVKPSVSSRRLLSYEEGKSLACSTIENSLSEYYAHRLRTIEYCLIPPGLSIPHPRLQDGCRTKLLMTKGTLVYIGLGAAN